MAEADTNRVARGQTWDSSHPDPYKQTWTYDVWNNLKRNGYNYDRWLPDFATYTNNRRSDSYYDANGNVTASPSYQNALDVFGSNSHAVSTQQAGDGSAQFPQQPAVDITQSYTADGRPATRTQIMRQNSYDPDTGEMNGVDQDTLVSHYIHASVLGARVVELDALGNASVWVYAGGQRIATYTSGQIPNTTFEHHNPVTSSWVTTHGHSGNRTAYGQERDPMNAEIPPMNPGNLNFAALHYHEPLFIEGGDPSDLSGGCSLDGMATACSSINPEAAEQCPAGGCGTHSMTVTARGKDGTVIGTSTLLVSQGQTGWDGSFDGNYRVNPSFAANFNFGSISGGRSFLNALDVFPSLFGHSTMEFFERTGGGANDSPQYGDRISPLSTGEVNQLRKDLSNVLSNSTCAKFMTAVLNQIGKDTGKAAFSSNAMDIFDAVKKQGGFGRGQFASNAQGGLTVGGGNAFININFNINFANADIPSIAGDVGRTILHELMHVGSGTNLDYSHYEMARAAWKIAKAQGYKVSGDKPSGGDPGGLDYENGVIFNNILFQACPNVEARK